MEISASGEKRAFYPNFTVAANYQERRNPNICQVRGQQRMHGATKTVKVQAAVIPHNILSTTYLQAGTRSNCDARLCGEYGQRPVGHLLLATYDVGTI